MSIFHNLKWLASLQGLRLLIGFFLGAWVVRMVGPADFGVLATAGAFSTLGGLVGEFGLRQLLLRDLSRKPKLAARMAGTVFKLWLLLGVACTLLLALWNWCRPTIPWPVFWPTVLPVTLLCFNLNHIWEDASHRAHVTARNGMTGYVTASALRMVALVLAPTLPILAWTIAAETVFTGMMGLRTAFQRGRGCWMHGWDRRIARAFLRRGFWMVAAQAGSLLLLRADTLMLQDMRGNAETGIYAAATRLSEMVYMLAPMMISVMLPRLAGLQKKHHTHAFEHLARKGSALMVALGLGSALALVLGGGLAIHLLYGPAYAASTTVLLVHCFATIPHFQGEWRQAVLVSMNEPGWSAALAWGALVLNVVLNLIWIPAHGALGAAWATLVSYSVCGYAGTWLVPRLRWFAKVQLYTLLSPFRWSLHPLASLHHIIAWMRQPGLANASYSPQP